MTHNTIGLRASRRMALPWSLLGAALAPFAHAAELSESPAVEFSNDRLAPTPWQLDAVTPAPGDTGFFANVLSGSVGRDALGTVDRDYVSFAVPAGYVLTALRVGNQTTSGGSQGSFIGLASGLTMPVDPGAASAAGLLGWRLYSRADRTLDILPAMSVPAQGSSGFTVPLPAGDYTLWMQELAPGSFNYRFNLVISAVPEPSTWLLLGGGLLALRTLRTAARARKA